MLPETWTILSLLKWTTTYFKSHGVDQARAGAEILLAHSLGVERLDLYVRYDQPVEPKELERFRGFVRRRVNREPVAYIVGRKEFWSMDLKVTPDVLIPRPETETLVEAALAVIQEMPHPGPLRILDLGAGSGAVVLAIASECPYDSFWAADRSESALAVAKENARTHGLAEAVEFLQGNWFDPVRERGLEFDVIVSNPPYISSHELRLLPLEILQYEPIDALAGGPDGLEAIRIIIDQAPNHMIPGGWLFLEIGHGHWAAVDRLILESKGYSEWRVTKDYSGCDRVVRARRRAGP